MATQNIQKLNKEKMCLSETDYRGKTEVVEMASIIMCWMCHACSFSSTKKE